MKLKHTQKKSANRSVGKEVMDKGLMGRSTLWRMPPKITKFTKPKRRNRQKKSA